MYGNCLRSRIGPIIANSNITDCADKCFKNNNCISWDIDSSNTCRTYKSCADHTMTNNDKSFVGIKNNTVSYGVKGKGKQTSRYRPS